MDEWSISAISKWTDGRTETDVADKQLDPLIEQRTDGQRRTNRTINNEEEGR